MKWAKQLSGIIGMVVFMFHATCPVLLAILFLVITVCFIKRHTIRENSVTEKALLKFGLFITIGQGINAVGQIVCPSLFLVFSSHRYRSVIVTVLSAIFDLTLTSTPILIAIFFKPVWRKLRKWFCSCCSKCSLKTTASSRGATQPWP